MIRILLADDHTLFRQGLRRILEEQDTFSVVGETASGIEAVELASELKPDVAVIDIGMKELNGIEATAQIVRRSPRTAVLILSMHSDERYVSRAMRAGARGYLLKDSVEGGLIRAILLVHKGQLFLSPPLAKTLEERKLMGLKSFEVEDRYLLLTERERQVHHMLAEGNSNKEIAVRLNLSLHTVETHRTRIMDKLGVHGIAELVLGAVKRGHLVH
jgi:two-component system, NarL family, response regulator NreC